MGLRKLIVTSATKTAEGWRIVAQSPNKIVRFLDVDEEGIGDNCEPWDDELERKFGAADPEHNVVLLDNEEPAEPAGEVIDINAAWADRYAKADAFQKRVNELRAPGPAAGAGATYYRKAAEHRLNVDAFNERVARLLPMAPEEWAREVVNDADAVVRFYAQLHPHSSPKFTDQVDELLTAYEEFFTEILNEFAAEPFEDSATRERRFQALSALMQRGQELKLAIREPSSVTDAMILGVARASERREARRKEAASRQEEAERHGNA
ncbi:hypothetical protein [Kocuria rosea]|uniref:hypothetical protein n=1 Tax=Kocuria rosea TaxID=1275 RepID=UPI00254098CF|nr:hypothetical protein [Kocuria rosea]WIG18375.1 hypothetical protein QOY29_05455 [Kocuria rosea]